MEDRVPIERSQVLHGISTPLRAKLEESLKELSELFKKYKKEEIAFSWNGGKDSTVVLHLIRSALKSDSDLRSFQTIFFDSDHLFEEVRAFTKSIAQQYGLNLLLFNSNAMAEDMQKVVDSGIKVVIMGTRKQDPDGENTSIYANSTSPYPAFIRFSPIINWDYGDVWEYIRYSSISFVSLYLHGYSSIGTKNDTKQNPFLLDHNGKYKPAWELVYYERERSGRSGSNTEQAPWKEAIKQEYLRRKGEESQGHRANETFPLVHDTTNWEEAISMVDVVLSGRLTMAASDVVVTFEKQFASYVGTKYAVMVNSGSSANLLAMAVMGNPLRKRHLRRGDHVLVPAVCWSTSVFPIVQIGCIPVFVDVDPKTFNISFDDLRRKITDKTRGIVAVHVLGNGADMHKLMEIVNKGNTLGESLIVLEDTCESLGSENRQKMLGTFADFGSYSFFYSHHMTTGEGGMVVCNNIEDYDLLLSMRAHGWTRSHSQKSALEKQYSDVDSRFLFYNTGFNLRPMAIQATMGLIQLKRLPQMNFERISNFVRLKKAIVNHPSFTQQIICMEQSGGTYPVWFGFPFLLDEKYGHQLEEYKRYLSSKGVDNRPIISGNFLRQPVIKLLEGVEAKVEDFPGAEILHKRGCFIGLDGIHMPQENIEILAGILIGFPWTSS